MIGELGVDILDLDWMVPVSAARRDTGPAQLISANIDPYFRGRMTLALTPENEAEVEEAYFQTLMLGGGFTLKGGRFLSGIGYQNEIHPHAWDFQDAPLAYRAFLGGRFNDDGLQLRWLAPTDLFPEFGAEVGRGRAFPSAELSQNGVGAWSLFAHAGGDVGASIAWRAGLSYLYAEPENRVFEDADSLGNPVTQSFTGTSKLDAGPQAPLVSRPRTQSRTLPAVNRFHGFRLIDSPLWLGKKDRGIFPRSA